jgi:hypothetical protein
MTVVEPLRPRKGGFLRPFGCGWFIRELLLGHGTNGSARIDPNVGAPQADIFYYYKTSLRNAVAYDRAAVIEEKKAKKEGRPIDPDRIDSLARRYLTRLPYKAWGCRYHSFVVYFSTIHKLDWVEPSGREMPSAFQDHYPPGPPRRYYRLTRAGREASETAWANPQLALYGSRPDK